MSPATHTTSEPPTMKTVLTDLGITQRDLARGAGLSKSAVHRLCATGEWPARREAAYRRKVHDYLQAQGAGPAYLRVALPPALPTPQEKAPESCELTGADRQTQEPTQTPTEDSMLLRNETLTPQARKAFSLPRSLFAVDDVQHRDDVYVSPSIRYVRAALLDAATNHGFIAIVGESGSGKSTLAEELEERIREEGKDVTMVRPYTIGMEQNDQKGKTLKVGAITEAIARALDPTAQLKSSPEARFAQIHAMLKASRRAGRRHVLVIEEAHCLPTATLKHLKRLLDQLKDGLQRVLGIALIAQPELLQLLSSQNPEVREVMQRCEVIQVEPLDNDLEAYLRHKMARSGVQLDDVLAADVFDAIRARMVQMPRGGKAGDAVSMCYPLAVNNLVCRAINAAAKAGWPKVDAQVIAGC